MTSERCYECEGELIVTCLKCNPRAVPDVPELVRYDKSDIYLAIENGYDPLLSDEGEYVRYDQAASIIAAKDVEVQELKEKLGVVSTERHADAEYIGHLKAELAQIKAQEPVTNYIVSDFWAGFDKVKMMPNGRHPLYAAPVDQTAEIERLRSAGFSLLASIDADNDLDSPEKFNAYHDFHAALSGKEPS